MAIGHGYWMPMVRVVELRIFDGIAGFERGVERFFGFGLGGVLLLGLGFGWTIIELAFLCF